MLPFQRTGRSIRVLSVLKKEKNWLMRQQQKIFVWDVRQIHFWAGAFKHREKLLMMDG